MLAVKVAEGKAAAVPSGAARKPAAPARNRARRDQPQLPWDFDAIPLFSADRTNGPAVAAPPGVLQAKLAIGPVDDPLEREADAVANRVMRMPDLGLTESPSLIQVSRKCGTCEEEDKQTLRAKPRVDSADGGEAPDSVRNTLSSPGEPLDHSTRAFFEPRFGADLSDVVVYRDSRAARSASEIDAKAYTVGDRIVFGPGNFAPNTRDGRTLLAHEIAHTLQQRAGSARPSKVRRDSPPPATETGGGLEDRAKLQASKDIIRLTQKKVDPDASGVGDFKAIFALLVALPMHDMLATLDELAVLGPFTLLQDEIGNAPDDARPRIQLAMSAVQDHGAVNFEGFKTAHAVPFAALDVGEQGDIQSFLATPARPAVPDSGQSAAASVANLPAFEKLSRALDFARSERNEAWNQAIEGLKSKQSIATMVLVATAFIAAQAIPVTWIADAAMLAGLTIAGFFLGVSIGSFFVNLAKFFNAINATSDADLRASGKALADAVAIFGIFAITGALSEGIGAGIRGAKITPGGGPPPTGFTDAYATNAGAIRVPNGLVPADAPTFPAKAMTTGGGKGAPPDLLPPKAKAPEAGEGTPEAGEGGNQAAATSAVVQQVIRDPNVSVGSKFPWKGKGPDPAWSNPKSGKAYDHIESTHGPNLKPSNFKGRIASTGNPQGQWLKADDWVTAEQLTPQHPGNYVIEFGRAIGRVFNTDGTVTENVTRAFVQRNADGTLNSGFPVDNNFTLE